MTSSGNTSGADFANLITSLHSLPNLRVDLEKMPVKRINRLVKTGKMMLDHHQIAIKTGHPTIERQLIISGYDYFPIPCCQYRRAFGIWEIDAVMRLPPTVLGG